jgi:hypothetical protein
MNKDGYCKKNIFNYIKNISKEPIFHQCFFINVARKNIDKERTSEINHYTGNYPKWISIIDEQIISIIDLFVEIVKRINENQDSFYTDWNGI